MLISFTTKTLKAALQISARAVYDRPAGDLPIDCFKLDKADGESFVRVTTFNLETAIELNVPVETGTDTFFSIAIPAKTLMSILSIFDDDDISFQFDDDMKLKVFGAKSRYEILMKDTKEFPSVPSVKKNEDGIIPTEFDIELENFAGNLAKVAFAASTDETKGAHRGIQIKNVEDRMQLVALDGYRLARRTLEYEGRLSEFVLRAKSVADVLKVFKGEKVTVRSDGRKVKISDGDVTLTTNCLVGEFLDWKRAVPTEFTVRVKINPVEMLAGVNKCAVVYNERMKTPLVFRIGEGVVKMEMKSPTATANCSVEGETDGDIAIAMSAAFLSDDLKALADIEELTISFTRPTGPLTITSEKDDSFLYLLLPVRIPTIGE